MGTDWGSRLKTYSTTSVKVRTIFLSLGKFFEKNDADIWLANHFFKMACDVSDRLEGTVGCIRNFQMAAGCESAIF